MKNRMEAGNAHGTEELFGFQRLYRPPQQPAVLTPPAAWISSMGAAALF